MIRELIAGGIVLIVCYTLSKIIPKLAKRFGTQPDEEKEPDSDD